MYGLGSSLGQWDVCVHLQITTQNWLELKWINTEKWADPTCTAPGHITFHYRKHCIHLTASWVGCIAVSSDTCARSAHTKISLPETESQAYFLITLMTQTDWTVITCRVEAFLRPNLIRMKHPKVSIIARSKTGLTRQRHMIAHHIATVQNQWEREGEIESKLDQGRDWLGNITAVPKHWEINRLTPQWA